MSMESYESVSMEESSATMVQTIDCQGKTKSLPILTKRRMRYLYILLLLIPATLLLISTFIANKHSADQDRELTLKIVSQHDEAADCWIAFHGVVYDMTEFADEHPGGVDAIRSFCGQDGTQPFRAHHYHTLLEVLTKEYVGLLSGAESIETRVVVNGKSTIVDKEVDMTPTHYASMKDTIRIHHSVSFSRCITLQELSKHDTAQDLWLVVNQKVLDLTTFAPQHLGGSMPLIKAAGTDATKVFHVFHGDKVLEDMGLQYQVGILSDSCR
jgi:cytochrome b involved in lipid metabolism